MSTPDPDATALVDSGVAYTPRGQAAEGQFAPGTVVAGRYRIASILGSGGMGEVYRADDTKLGQTVALKFLPARLARDPILLGRLHDEVRLGRQIAHPNVCHIYDIVDFGTSHFVAMEYVDGEDLSRLLKRIGRLAHDKAVDIARGIAAGLAAAHAKGILHRDLKPANVMIDSRGESRVMDFGLALAAGEHDGTISGTPAYMAPELLEGDAATVQSDVYALGLVMYELFTGKRAHNARTLPERVRELTSGIATPSAVIRDIDPAVERIILRCLANDPAQRPRSAREVIQALPGGDPLAAAVAAGETPSPRAVAAAGTAGSLRPAVAWALLIPIVGMIVLFFAMTVRGRYWQRSGMTRAPEVEADRAKELLRRIGVPEQEFRAYGFMEDATRRQWLIRRDPSALNRIGGDLTLLRFWMREEPEPLVDRGLFRNPEPGLTTPPQSAPGSVAIEIDPRGRLLSLRARAAERWRARPAEWSTLLRAAGLDPARLTPATPRFLPPSFADARAAWSGRHPDNGSTIHVEAASFRGIPIFFRVVAPWDTDVVADPFGEGGAFVTFGAFLIVTVVAAGVVMAWRNVRQRRGDRQGSMRVAVVLFIVTFVHTLAVADHEAALAHELELLTLAIGQGLLIAALFSLLYLALEPFIRRRWPQGLVSWARLVSGSWRDPMIGRDVLIGFIGGLLHTLIASGLLTGGRSGPFHLSQPTSFNTALKPIAHIAESLQSGIVMGLVLMILLMLFMIVLRRRAFAAAGMFAVYMAAYSRVSTEPESLATFAVLAAVLTFVVARYGLLAAVVAHASFIAYFHFAMPDALAWYTLRASIPALVFLALAIWAFHTSLGGQRAFAASPDE